MDTKTHTEILLLQCKCLAVQLALEQSRWAAGTVMDGQNVGGQFKPGKTNSGGFTGTIPQTRGVNQPPNRNSATAADRQASRVNPPPNLKTRTEPAKAKTTQEKSADVTDTAAAYGELMKAVEGLDLGEGPEAKAMKDQMKKMITQTVEDAGKEIVESSGSSHRLEFNDKDKALIKKLFKTDSTDSSKAILGDDPSQVLSDISEHGAAAVMLLGDVAKLATGAILGAAEAAGRSYGEYLSEKNPEEAAKIEKERGNRQGIDRLLSPIKDMVGLMSKDFARQNADYYASPEYQEWKKESDQRKAAVKELYQKAVGTPEQHQKRANSVRKAYEEAARKSKRERERDARKPARSSTRSKTTSPTPGNLADYAEYWTHNPPNKMPSAAHIAGGLGQNEHKNTIQDTIREFFGMK